MNQLLKQIFFLFLCSIHLAYTLFGKGDFTEPVACFATHKKQKRRPNKKKISYDTLEAWHNAIHAFEEFPDDYVKRSPLCFDELLDALHNAQNAVRVCHKNSIWLNNNSLPPDTYDLSKDILSPYVQKLLISDNAEIALFGDVHGSAHSILRGLRQLQKLGWFSKDFKIIKPNAYIFFLGDQVDRGKWGVEVIYTLLRLKAANPQQFIQIRGNHERIKCKYSYAERKKDKKQNFEFVHELQQKYPYANQEELEKIFYSFNSLPYAVYVGKETNGIADFLQVSHGAVDLGYDPSNLFEDSKAQYEYISEFSRAKNLKRLSSDSQKIITETLQKTHPEELINFKQEKISDPRTGLMWHDFLFNGDQLVFDKAGSWNMGRQLFEEILNFGTNADHKLHGILRGHEHNYNTYPGLWDTHGALPSWDSKVITLFSGPANALPTGDKKLIFNYDSFSVLSIKKEYKDWHLTHWWREFKTKRKPHSRTRGWQSETVPLPDQAKKNTHVLNNKKAKTAEKCS